MDNFMDKITEKLNSQEIIKANAAADAAALENLEKQLALFKDQMEKYDGCLQEMRRLNLKNIESAQGVNELAQKANDTLGHTAGELENASVSRIKEASAASIAGINQTLSESLAKIAEIKENSDALDKVTANMTETMEGLNARLEELFKSMEDFLHIDNVKVYRNVQASMVEELGKQTAEIKEEQGKAVKSSKVMLPYLIVTMVAVIINLAITIARVLGLF